MIESYRHTITITNTCNGKDVIFSPSGFNDREEEQLVDRNRFDIVLTPIGASDWDDLKLRNLKWIKADPAGENRK